MEDLRLIVVHSMMYHFTRTFELHKNQNLKVPIRCLKAYLTCDYSSIATEISFAESSYAVPESMGTVNVIITRSGDTSQPVCVDFTTESVTAVGEYTVYVLTMNAVYHIQCL